MHKNSAAKEAACKAFIVKAAADCLTAHHKAGSNWGTTTRRWKGLGNNVQDTLAVDYLTVDCAAAVDVAADIPESQVLVKGLRSREIQEGKEMRSRIARCERNM